MSATAEYVQPEPPEGYVTLRLSVREAEAIYSLFGKVEGNALNSPRYDLDSVFFALSSALKYPHTDTAAHAMMNAGSKIEFFGVYPNSNTNPECKINDCGCF
jgi:hypothetical protein